MHFDDTVLTMKGSNCKNFPVSSYAHLKQLNFHYMLTTFFMTCAFTPVGFPQCYKNCYDVILRNESIYNKL